MKLLMITGDRALAQGKKGAFYYTLEEFSKHWERIDIICPRISNISNKRSDPTLQTHPTFQPFNNVFIHSSLWPLIFQPWFILKKGKEIFENEKFDLFTIHSYPPFYNDIGGLWLYSKLKAFLSSRSFQSSQTPQSFQASQAFQAIPYILEVHHITGYPKAGDLKEYLYKNLTGLFIKKFAKNAFSIRVVNQRQTPEFLIKSGVSKEKLKYIPSAYIDLEVFKPLNSDKKYDLVFAGRLTKNKGIDLLLKTVRIIKLQIPNFKLVIVGDGPLKNRIKDFIKHNKFENNIEFAGWLPGTEDVAKIYNQSKIFIMPSFNEGGPRVNLEAMACKTAVVTTRVGLMMDVIQDGENGVFIDWSVEDIAGKTINLLENNNLREKIAENGYRAAQQFERKKMIQQYADAYKRLINE